MSAEKKAKTTIPELEIRVLGRFEVLRDGELIPDKMWGRRKTMTLLKILLTDPGHVFTQDQLIDALFGGENVDRARENLYSRVSQLRRALEPNLKRGANSHFVLREGQGYSFDVNACSALDTEAFAQGLNDSQSLAEKHDWTAAAERFEETIALYRGEFLAENRYDDWAEEARIQFRKQYLDAMAQLAECYEQLGRLRQAISYCQRILALEPHRESVIQRQMEYQTQAGQRDAALDTYVEGESALREYLDVAPSAGMQALRDELTCDVSEIRHLDPRRIAVLPLASYSPKPEDDYFADGMTEELIASLSKIKDFRVVARTSVARYHGTAKPITQISRELGAGTILEGSVRKAGGKVRITVQLIDGLTEDHLWAEHYDVDIGDILEVQTEIARRASEALKLELLSDEVSALDAVKQRDSEAHMSYLKGRHHLQKYGKKALETAIGYFEAALRKDPAYARALTGLSDTYLRMEAFTSSEESFQHAKAYAEQALALDDSLPEVYTSLAFVVEGNESSDLEEVERLLRLAIHLDPSYALAHARLAQLLNALNRTDEAADAIKEALTLDPLSPRLTELYASCLFATKQYIKAAEQARNVLELDAENDSAWWIIWFSHAALWDWKRGEAILREMVEKCPDNPLAYVFLSVSVQTNGRIHEGIDLLEKALRLPGAREQAWVLHQGGLNFTMAQQYDRALDLLDEGVQRWPMNAGFRVARAFCYLMQGRFDDCLGEMAVVEEALVWKAYAPRIRGRVYAARGEIEKAEAELKTLIEHTEYPNRCLCIAYVLAGLGRIEEAIDWFEKSADAHESHIATIRKLPTAPRELREHPRFHIFLNRVGLAD